MDQRVLDLLREAKVIAVVGISDKPERPSFQVAAYLQGQGYQIVPVHPGHRHDDAGAPEALRLGEEAVQPRHPHVVDTLHVAPEKIGGDRGLLRHRDVGGAGGQDQDPPRPPPVVPPPDGHRPGLLVEDGVGGESPDAPIDRGRRPGGQEAAAPG